MLKCHQFLFLKLIGLAAFIQQFSFLYSFLCIFVTKTSTNVCKWQIMFSTGTHMTVTVVLLTRTAYYLEKMFSSWSFPFPLKFRLISWSRIFPPMAFRLVALICCSYRVYVLSFGSWTQTYAEREHHVWMEVIFYSMASNKTKCVVLHSRLNTFDRIIYIPNRPS